MLEYRPCTRWKRIIIGISKSDTSEEMVRNMHTSIDVILRLCRWCRLTSTGTTVVSSEDTGRRLASQYDHYEPIDLDEQHNLNCDSGSKNSDTFLCRSRKVCA